MSAAVEASGIVKRFGSLVAVEDLTFTAEAGEVLGVLGPNGAGKTTAIRILTTVLHPTQGTFSVAGIPHSRPAEIRLRTGVLPESAGYPEHVTGGEYLRYHARLFGQSRASASATAATLLEQVGLTGRAGSLVAEYSRGMRQRLGIARALVNDPRVVFLDEPTLGLDPAGQREVLELVRRLAQDRGATILLSTHLLDEVEETCGRVLILNGGRVVAAGTVAEVARRAAAPRTARLRVHADRADEASRALELLPGWSSVETTGDGTGRLRATLVGDASRTGADGLCALFENDIELLAFELESARLSDAFLAMTGAA